MDPTMLIKKSPDIRESEVTPKDLYLRRREFIKAASVTAAAAATGMLGTGFADEAGAQNPQAQKFSNLVKSPFSTDEKLNSYQGRHDLQQFLRVRPRQGRSRRAYARTCSPGRGR